jgi:hypothetical protein
MSTTFFILTVAFAVALLALLFMASRSSRRARRRRDGLAVLDSAPQHLCHMGPIRRSQDGADLQYVADRGGRELAERLRRERHEVALLYLDSLRADFEQLLRIARVVALLSPEISSSHEYERLRLAVQFRFRFQLVKLRLFFGDAAMPQVAALGETVSTLAIRMEAAMQALGERATLAADLALTSQR